MGLAYVMHPIYMLPFMFIICNLAFVIHYCMQGVLAVNNGSNDRAERFFRSLAGKTAAFIGIGVSHTETMKMFLSRGVRVLACDRRERAQFGAVANELEQLGAVLHLGDAYLENWDADVVFRAPGVYFHSPQIARLRARGLVVTSETEMFLDLCPCRVFATTGSEGKTTTSTVIAEILRAQGKTVHLGGNIGRALLPIVFDIQPEDCAVVELSSFQLLSMRQAPDVALMTNITPDHLDVHADMAEYVGAKQNIYRHQGAFSRTVLNADNELTASFGGEVRGELLTFSLQRPVAHGAYYQDGVLYAVSHGAARPVLNAKDIKIPGMHNVANYLAAICATADYAGDEAVHRTAQNFGGVEHRLEFVRELDGVRWYNDSIATAPVGVIAGLNAFGDKKLVVIGGGQGKNIPFDPLAPEFIAHAKLLILTGPTAADIAQVVRDHPQYHGLPEIIMAQHIPHAVAIARERAVAGDIVSLSPAAASFDAYPNFEARGRHFKELVHAL